jgi:hypothetical protein
MQYDAQLGVLTLPSFPEVRLQSHAPKLFVVGHIVSTNWTTRPVRGGSFDVTRTLVGFSSLVLRPSKQLTSNGKCSMSSSFFVHLPVQQPWPTSNLCVRACSPSSWTSRYATILASSPGIAVDTYFS